MNKFRSGFCGVILVMHEGVYQRRTWGQKSHERCPGGVSDVTCECSCHAGEEPWTKNGEYTGHKPVVLHPIGHEPETHRSFTQVKKARAARKAVTGPPTTAARSAVADTAVNAVAGTSGAKSVTARSAVTDMQRALSELEDLHGNP